MTTLTKTGEPRQGTKLEVQLMDDSWVTVTVVGKAWAQSGGLRLICIEAEDGGRQWVPWGDQDGIVWRAESAEQKSEDA